MNDIRGKCDLLRSDCKYMESVARDLMKSKVFISFAETFEGQHDESILDSPQEAKP